LVPNPAVDMANVQKVAARNPVRAL